MSEENDHSPDPQAGGSQPKEGQNTSHPNLVRMHERLANKNRTGRQRLKLLLYDPDSQSYLDRTCGEWWRAIVFYSTLYIFIGVIFMVCYGLYANIILSVKLPARFGRFSLLGKYPALSLVSPPGVTTFVTYPLIEFNPSDSQTWQPHVSHLRKTFQKYAKKPDGNELEYCGGLESVAKKMKSPTISSCYFNVSEAGPCSCSSENCDNVNFGYDSGEPCIAISVAKHVGWKPYQSSAALKYQDIHQYLMYKKLKIQCSATLEEDKTKFENIELFPKAGMKVFYYPYWNADEYQQPFTMVRLVGAKKGQLIKLNCSGFSGYKRMLKVESAGIGYLQFHVKVN